MVLNAVCDQIIPNPIKNLNKCNLNPAFLFGWDHINRKEMETLCIKQVSLLYSVIRQTGQWCGIIFHWFLWLSALKHDAPFHLPSNACGLLNVLTKDPAGLMIMDKAKQAKSNSHKLIGSQMKGKGI